MAEAEPLFFVYGAQETEYLKARDPRLGAVIDTVGPIRRAVTPDLFAALINAIVGQQISTKAQATIWARLCAQLAPLSPATIAAAPPAALQGCGMSLRKADYIRGIATAVLDGSLDLQALSALPDDDIIRRLSALKGIGVWTAEMLLTFSLQRPNVISSGDLAILRGLRMLYRHRVITPRLFAKYRRRYAPYATVASLYLWAIAGGAIPDLTDPAVKK